MICSRTVALVPGLRSSLELRSGVAVPLEGSVDDIGTLIDEVRHDWLVHGTVPCNVSRHSHSVPVASTVVLVEDWRLSSSPLSVSVWDWWVAWQHTGHVPPEQVWIVKQSSLMESMIVENNWSLISQTSANSTRHEEDHVCIGDPASHIEVLNWQLSNDGETQEASELSSSGIVGPVMV